MAWRITINGELGGPGPDGFMVTFANIPADPETGPGTVFTSFVAPDELREFWHRAGEELRDFDEMAGAPSSEEAA